MIEENKKRINKLIVLFTKRTISFLTATTMLVTGTVGCKKEEKEKNKDNSSIISSVPDDEITSSDEELTIEDNVQSNTNEESNIGQSNNEASNNTTSNDNKVNSDNKNNQTNNNSSNNNNSGNKNNQTNNSNNNNNNQNSSSNTSKPSNTTSSTPSTTPSKPTMPSTLTASNINDVEVFKHFAEKLSATPFPGSAMYKYTYYHNKVSYTTDGVKECQLILAMLNIDYINDNTLKSLFGDCTLEQMMQYSSFVNIIIDINDKKEIVYDFNKYMINSDLGNYLMEFQRQYINASNYKEIDKFKNTCLDYYINKNGKYKYKVNNDWVENYICTLSSIGSTSIDLDLFFMDKASEIENSYINKVEDIYNKVKGKTKVLIN